MALLKDVAYKGIVCNYHKIITVEAHFINDVRNSGIYTSLSVKVALYVDVAQRNTDSDHWLRLKSYHFKQGDVGAPNTEKINKVYKALKDSAEFAGAVDA